jgi:hypothetical protein
MLIMNRTTQAYMSPGWWSVTGTYGSWKWTLRHVPVNLMIYAREPLGYKKYSLGSNRKQNILYVPSSTRGTLNTQIDM